MQQKKYLKPKIAMLNIELELKAERDNAEIRLDNIAVSNLSNLSTAQLNISSCSGVSKDRRCRMVDSLR